MPKPFFYSGSQKDSPPSASGELLKRCLTFPASTGGGGGAGYSETT